MKRRNRVQKQPIRRYDRDLTKIEQSFWAIYVDSFCSLVGFSCASSDPLSRSFLALVF